MPRITYILKDGTRKTVDAQSGLSLMEVSQKNGIGAVEGACGGSLSCATCHVYIHPDWWVRLLPEDGKISDQEEDMLDLAFDLRKTSRLCCQTMVTDDLDGLVVAVPGAETDW